jgi:hypothetical protein
LKTSLFSLHPSSSIVSLILSTLSGKDVETE